MAGFIDQERFNQPSALSHHNKKNLEQEMLSPYPMTTINLKISIKVQLKNKV